MRALVRAIERAEQIEATDAATAGIGGAKIYMLDNYDLVHLHLYQAFANSARRWWWNATTRPPSRRSRRDFDDIDGIVISPGPCTPAEAGISIDLVHAFAGRKPILGVCLGHQSIGAAYGGEIVHALSLMHGKTSLIDHDGTGALLACPTPSSPRAITR